MRSDDPWITRSIPLVVSPSESSIPIIDSVTTRIDEDRICYIRKNKSCSHGSYCNDEFSGSKFIGIWIDIPDIENISIDRPFDRIDEICIASRCGISLIIPRCKIKTILSEWKIGNLETPSIDTGTCSSHITRSEISGIPSG